MRHEMKILVAPDKFKGSLGAAEVAANLVAGLHEVLPTAEIVCCPVADGGEGTAEIIRAARTGEWRGCKAHDAYGEEIRARFAWIGNGTSAVIETSHAIGLWRVPPEARDPVQASSFGAGEMLLGAARLGVARVMVGLGGSATNDGGFGLARALGFRFLDDAGVELAGPVSQLLRLARIERPSALVLPEVVVAADVRNPLLGEHGATRVFSAQKGATREQADLLERAFGQLADVVARDFGVDRRAMPGAGAAGGLGFGLASFCDASLRSGFEVVAEAIGLAEKIAAADVVVTGEGRLDAQTREGKAPAGVACLARQRGRRCYAIVGEVENGGGFGDLFESVSVLGTSPGAGGKESAELIRVRAAELGRLLQG